MPTCRQNRPQEKTLDRRSDIFALGILLWEMTTGHRLFKADNEIATLHKIIGGNYPPPSAYRDGYHPQLELIVLKALSTDVRDRYQDCGEMQLALEDFLLSHGMAAGTKRLAYYIRSITSGEDVPLPKLSSVVSQYDSDSGVHTPSPDLGCQQERILCPRRVCSGSFTRITTPLPIFSPASTPAVSMMSRVHRWPRSVCLAEKGETGRSKKAVIAVFWVAVGLLF